MNKIPTFQVLCGGNIYIKVYAGNTHRAGKPALEIKDCKTGSIVEITDSETAAGLLREIARYLGHLKDFRGFANA